MNLLSLVETVLASNSSNTTQTNSGLSVDWDWNDCNVLISKPQGGDGPSPPGGGNGPVNIDPPGGEDGGGDDDNDDNTSNVENDEIKIGSIVQDSISKKYGIVVGIYGDEIHTKEISSEEVARITGGNKSATKMVAYNNTNRTDTAKTRPISNNKLVAKNMIAYGDTKKHVEKNITAYGNTNKTNIVQTGPSDDWSIFE